VLFLVVPVFITNASVVLSMLASMVSNIAISQLLSKMIGVITVNIITLILSAIMIIVSVSRPLNAIRKSLSLLAENAGDISNSIPTDLSDEFAHISHLMNRTFDNFRAMVVKLKEISELLFTSTQNLSVSSSEISATSNQQAAAVKEIVSTMEDSDELTRTIQDKVTNLNTFSNQTRLKVVEGFGFVKENMNKMDEIKGTNTNTITNIKGLGEQIEGIGEIVKIISKIADQTKIIAFNAELEASSAGEAGRNFEIVASEIRRLADNTVSSTMEIRSKIKSIQESKNQLIKLSEKDTDKIGEGWELSIGLNKVFEEILSNSEKSATHSDQISLSINQQVASTRQILMTLKQISEGIDNFVVSTKSTTESTMTLRETANGLNTLIAKFIV
jgi:methyl-accepting chemotaxis protein